MNLFWQKESVENGKRPELANFQWRRNDFQVEGAGAPPLQNYLRPGSRLSSDFDHVIFKISRTKKIEVVLNKCKSFIEIAGHCPRTLKVRDAIAPSAPPFVRLCQFSTVFCPKRAKMLSDMEYYPATLLSKYPVYSYGANVLEIAVCANGCHRDWMAFLVVRCIHCYLWRALFQKRGSQR